MCKISFVLQFPIKCDGRFKLTSVPLKCCVESFYVIILKQNKIVILQLFLSKNLRLASFVFSIMKNFFVLQTRFDLDFQ